MTTMGRLEYLCAIYDRYGRSTAEGKGRISVAPGTFTYSGIASGFRLRLFVMNPTCPASTIGTTVTESCVQSSALTFTGPGTFYLFAASEAFTGVPCGSKYRLTIAGPNIPPCVVTGVDDSLSAGSGLEAALAIRGNPSHAGTTVDFVIPPAGQVSLQVYDASGRLIRTLIEGVLEPGRRSVRWNGRDGNGRRVAAGVYLYALNLDDRLVARRKAVLLQ